MSLFQHVPHPRIEQRRTTGPTKVNDLRMKVPGPVGRLNARFGLFITVVVGTMWCAYLFTLLALVSLPAALKSGSKIIIVAWIAQTFLQLVLLPIILVGQNVIQAANDVRAEADHKTLTAIHRLTVEVHAINEAQTGILKELERTRRE